MKTILITTDLSKNASNSLKYAIQFAKEKKNKLVVFHSFYDPGLNKVKNAKYTKIIDAEVAHLTNKLQTELKNTYRSLNIPFSLKNIEVIVKFGKSVVENIKQTVSEKQIDLIIISTHGETGLKTLLFGSNTIKLISTTKTPVLVIPVGCKFKAIKKIIYSTDLSNSKNELKQLIKVNEIFKAKLGVVYFDNGIEKTKEELKSLKLINDSGLTIDSVSVPIDSYLIQNIIQYVKNKKEILPCLFHSQKNKLLTLLLGSNSNDLVLHFKSPFISLKK
jgi:nucleotide-binding universal stress UspA family protein